MQSDDPPSVNVNHANLGLSLNGSIASRSCPMYPVDMVNRGECLGDVCECVYVCVCRRTRVCVHMHVHVCTYLATHVIDYCVEQHEWLYYNNFIVLLKGWRNAN